MVKKLNVVVIGGGYAGVMAANRLTQRRDVAVHLINPRPRFVERMRLHRLVAGTGEAVAEFPGILSDQVRLVVDTATEIDPVGRGVKLAAGRIIAYDYLIYAVGSGSARPNVSGAAEFAHPISTLEDAMQARSIIAAAPRSVPVTVVGSGLTGIEVAAELGEQGRRATLVSGDVVGAYLHPRVRATVANRLEKLGVTVVSGPGARVAAVKRGMVQLADDRQLPGAVTLWTAGFAVPDLAARSGLRTDSAGRLLTDESLTSIDSPRILAAGDSAAPSDLPYRMSAFSAQNLGAHAADTVLRRIAGEAPDTISLGFLGVCVGLGRRFATLQFARADDTATSFSVSGRLAALLVKEGGTRGVLRALAHEARKPGSHTLRRTDGTRPDRVQAKRANMPAIAERAA